MMSGIKTSIDLSPPEFAVREERMFTVPMTCGCCHGQGHFASFVHPYGDDVATECPVCKGSGRVEAEVRIRWKPSEGLGSPD